MIKKIIPKSKAAVFFQKINRRKNKVVFTNGTFDILHLGHVRYLQKSRAQGSLLVVGVNSDASVRRYKGPNRPINTQKDRLEVLAALECVDYVVLFGEDTPLNLIKAIKPDVLVKGADWKKEDIVGASEVESWGGQVRRIRFVQGKSTTGTIEKILKKPEAVKKK